MGISIKADTGQADPDFPIGVVVTLECDAATDIFCRGVSTYRRELGFIDSHHVAMNDGWLERQTDNGRQWICPRCSGK